MVFQPLPRGFLLTILSFLFSGEKTSDTHNFSSPYTFTLNAPLKQTGVTHVHLSSSTTMSSQKNKHNLSPNLLKRNMIYKENIYLLTYPSIYT